MRKRGRRKRERKKERGREIGERRREMGKREGKRDREGRPNHDQRSMINDHRPMISDQQ